MRQIRFNTFETNSSSSHSLVIRSTEVIEPEEAIYCTPKELREGLRISKDGEYKSYNRDWYFGRFPFRPIFSFEDKFQYAYASYCYNDQKLAELEEILKELIPEIKTIRKPESLGTDDNFLDYWLKTHAINLKEFLTNKKYVVIQDGDEYCVWRKLVKTNLIDLEALDNKDEVIRDALE